MKVEWPHVYRPGDQRPPMALNFKGDDKKVLNLIGYTVSATLNRSPGDAVSLTVNTIDESKGQYTITFAATDLIEGRDQEICIDVTDSGGEAESIGTIVINVDEACS